MRRFPAENGQRAQMAVTFVGFDPDAKRWNIAVVNDGGSCYTRYGSSPDFNGSRWVDGYPADGGQAITTLGSGKLFRFPASR